MRGDHFLSVVGSVLESNVQVKDEITNECVFMLVPLNHVLPTAMHSHTAPPAGTKFQATVPNACYKLKHMNTGYFVAVNIAAGGSSLQNEDNVEITADTAAKTQWYVAPPIPGTPPVTPPIPGTPPVTGNVFGTPPPIGTSGELVFTPKAGTGFALNLAAGGAHQITNVQVYNNPTSPDSHWQLFKVCRDTACANDVTTNAYLIKSMRGDLFLSAAGNADHTNVEVTRMITDDCRFMLVKTADTC